MTEQVLADTPANPAGQPQRHERRGLVLAVILIAQLMVVLDMSIVNVALPDMQRALGFSPTGLSWVLNAYSLAFGGLLLLGAHPGILPPSPRRRPLPGGHRAMPAFLDHGREVPWAC